MGDTCPYFNAIAKWKHLCGAADDADVQTPAYCLGETARCHENATRRLRARAEAAEKELAEVKEATP